MGMRRRGPGMRGGMAMWGPQLAERLKLTDEQRTRMRDIMDQQRRHAIQSRADLQIARLDLGKLMRADDPDASAIDAQIDKLARLRADLAKSRVASLMEAREVLTPEQRDQLKQMRQHPGMGRGRGPGGPGRPGGPGGSGDGEDGEDGGSQ